jgi:hypothetical protein
LIQEVVLKRASNEAGISAAKLNLRKAVALQQIVADAAPLGESLMIAWPQTVGLIASTVLFVAGFVVLQRQEMGA